MKSMDKVNNLNKSDFISIFGNVFEKTNWIAEKVYNFKPFSNFNEIKSKFMDYFEKTSKENHLKIFNSHPELVVEKIMTKDSIFEQNNAELNKCSDKEIREFTKLNKDYKKKFGFPFIIAVSGKNKLEILKNFRKRVNNTKLYEFKKAKKQVKEIAIIRLKKINLNY